MLKLLRNTNPAIVVCSQQPKDLVITWVVLALDTLLIYFWDALLGYTFGVHFWGALLGYTWTQPFFRKPFLRGSRSVVCEVHCEHYLFTVHLASFHCLAMPCLAPIIIHHRDSQFRSKMSFPPLFFASNWIGVNRLLRCVLGKNCS